MINIPLLLMQIFNATVLAYFFVLNGVYLITGIVAFFALRRYSQKLRTVTLDDMIAYNGSPPITLIAPAYNESATCVSSTKSLLSLNYPDYEILMVNDGSRDNTLQEMIDAFDMVPTPRTPTAFLSTAPVRDIYQSQNYPNLWIVDKVNGGKADALNTGLNFCRTPLFCAMDSDSLLERDALSRVVYPFLEDVRTVAAGGIIRIVNGCEVKNGVVTKVGLPKSLLARFQVLEYLRAFLSGRMGWDALGLTFIISGAFGIFKRSTVIEAGAYRTDTVGEDMELVVRLHKYCRQNKIPYRIKFVPDPVAWTECPESERVLGRQRDRWQRGLMEVLTRHKDMFFNPRYGKVGTVIYPYFFLLEMAGPFIEFPGYLTFFIAWLTGNISMLYFSAFFVVAFVFGIALSVFSVALEELSFRRYPRGRDLIELFWIAIIENFGYRQMSTYWRIKGAISFFRNVKTWGEMERKGFNDKKKK
jgi:cellulose synthase/poly-beta-1,6-N-acetylglucosamine synthase-like glycosyltransferase